MRAGRGVTTGWLVFCIAVPLAWAVLLMFHGAVVAEAVYASLADQADRWLVGHLFTLVFIGLTAVALHRMVRDLPGTAARVARLSSGVFALFYGAGESLLGVGTGVLARRANDAPADQQAAAADGAQALWDSFISADLFLIIGSAAWVTAAVSAALAHLKAGASPVGAVLLGVSSIAAIHTPPIAPTGLASFAVAAALLLRRQPADASGR